ncbi:MAG TPA: choice-of-anchor tandem repeat GloVer-containing protein [Candidatus Aquilonibacter sp.]|nr:choice-of-anchor tandem repeat GloVer-containing protein [Candidatus Aquilonibacter sp.]
MGSKPAMPDSDMIVTLPMMSNPGFWKTLCFTCVFCIASVIASSAQTFTTLVNLDDTDGAYPFAGLVEGSNGNFYGTTLRGGANITNCTNGCGTIFQMTGRGQLSTLYSFCAKPGCMDGSYPYSAPVEATNGMFYGTTFQGGLTGDGTVFEVSAKGAYTMLHSFNGTDGEDPYAGLILGSDGNLYGTTLFGGANGYGAIFKITPAGALTTLYSFCAQANCTDGQFPYAGLMQASNGDFYGTTAAGGANSDGTVFELTSAGRLTTLYSFCSETNCTDGYFPYAGLVQATDGNLYGTTYYGGSFTSCGIGVGCGTVFRVTPGGVLTTLHSFDGTDGQYSFAGLVQATDGNLYGTTYTGGPSGDGTIFEISLSGTLTTLHNFAGSDGDFPVADVVQATNGSFYGTSAFGGTNNDGALFSLDLGLGPFVEILPTSAKVGTTVMITGSNLTKTTGVSFNGTAASFKVVSTSEIQAAVPKGATSGEVKVKTASGTLTSNVTFQVR